MRFVRDKIGIGLIAMFADVQPLNFLVKRNADPQHRLDRKPGNGGSDQHKTADRHYARKLRHEKLGSAPAEKAVTSRIRVNTVFGKEPHKNRPQNTTD